MFLPWPDEKSGHSLGAIKKGCDSNFKNNRQDQTCVPWSASAWSSKDIKTLPSPLPWIYAVLALVFFQHNGTQLF